MRCKFKGCYKLAVGSTTWCRSHSPAPTAHNITGTTSSSGTSSSGNGASAAVNKTSTTTGNTVGGTTNTTTAATGLGLRNYLNDLVFQSEKMTQKGKDSSDDSDSDMDEAQVLYGRSHMK